MSALATTSPSTTSSSLKHLIKRHPLLSFFVIAFAGAWLAVLPLLLARNGVGLLPITLPDQLFTALGTLTGPMLAAITVTAIVSGKAGVRQLLRRCLQWRVGIRWYLLVLFGFPVLYVIAASIVLGTTPLSTLIEQWTTFFTVYLPAVLTYIALGTLGEETGWSGFALPRLQEKYGPLWGACILGAIWAFWHLPGYFGGWMGTFNIVSFVMLILIAVLFRIVWTWIYNNTRGSILLPILFHSVTTSAGVWFLKLIPTFPPLIALVGYTLLLVCVILIIASTRGRLSYHMTSVTSKSVLNS